MSDKGIYKCSFCRVTEAHAKKIVAKGRKDEAAICSDCVVECVKVLVNLASVHMFGNRNDLEGSETTADLIKKGEKAVAAVLSNLTNPECGNA